jgi:hypothetical protein
MTTRIFTKLLISFLLEFLASISIIGWAKTLIVRGRLHTLASKEKEKKEKHVLYFAGMIYA